MRYFRTFILWFYVFLQFTANGHAQTKFATIVKGLITDSETNEPLPFAYITFINSDITALSDSLGVFTIETVDTTTNLKIGLLGYESVILPVEVHENQFILVKLHPDSKMLKEVVVKGKRKRYRNKDNPAVKIIEEVIAHKSTNRKENIDNLRYEQYQKILLSLDNMHERLEENWLLRPYRFIFENTDTTISSGKKLVPVYLKEDISELYYRKKPPVNAEIIKAEKLVSFDEYIDRKTLTTSVNYLYQDINIYDNNIVLFSNRFLSPIANLAPAFYKFFISDTTVIDSIKCIKLAFSPRNKSDFLFQGSIFITMDSLYAVKKLSMHVNKDINLNWVKSLNIDQEFKKTGSDWLLYRNEMNADFGITENSLGMFGQKLIVYKSYSSNPIPVDSIKTGKKSDSPAVPHMDDSFWNNNRPVKLKTSEKNVYVFMDSLNNLPEFHRDMKILSILTLGYLRTGPVEFGPTTALYSHNPIEGSRVRLGFRTTKKFNRKIYLEAYGAYGFKDQQFKSDVNMVYSLNNKSVREFPLKSLSFTFQNDLKIPGEDLLNAQSDNTFLSIKRGVNDKMYFNKFYKIEHLNEFSSHFSYNLSYEYIQNKPLGNLYFNTTDYSSYSNNVDQIKIGQFTADLRYAPHERFVQGNRYRTFFPNKYPVLEFKYTYGSKILGGDYNFQKIQANISKRFNMSILGYTDLSLEAGKVFGSLPYPMLEIHRANQTYAYQPLSYNLMNFLEVISDQYGAMYLDHNFNGFFFNKIPLLKKLKFREAFTFKMLYGSLGSANNPAYHTDLFQFPTDKSGNPISFGFDKKPYIEAGFGITNIFKFFRIDYIQRFSYLDHPGISKSGIRIDYKFDF